jgi:hypothetical protein
MKLQSEIAAPIIAEAVFDPAQSGLHAPRIPML